MNSPAGPRNPLTRRRLGLALAVAATATALGTAPALAAPADTGPDMPTPPIPRGMPQIATDVLGPNDPAFWNPAISGTRVLTPIEPGAEVACATGFVPVISCSTGHRPPMGTAKRPLEFIDVPVTGGALRVWFDVPRLGDGSTEEPVRRIVTWWATNPTLS